MMMAGAVGRPLTYDHTAWLLRHGLVTRSALKRYEAYALPDLIAYAYPQAEGEEQGLLVDILGWFTVLDDHFDGHAGRDLSGTRDLVRRLLDALQEPGQEFGPEFGPELGRGSGADLGPGSGTADPGPARRTETHRDPGATSGTDPGAGPGAESCATPRPDRRALSDGLAPAAPDPAPPARAGHGRPQASGPLGRRHVLGSRALARTSSATGPDPAQLLAAWRDLWRRQRTGMPAAWSRRAARDWARCLTTFVTEASHRTAATLPTLGQAVHLRRHASCLYPFMNMLERVRGTALPEALHAERELRLLRAHVADTATLVNDLYSLEREERHSCPFNMIVILRREQRMSRSAAVEAVRAEIDRLSIRSDILRNYLAAHHPEADWYLRQTHWLVEGVKLWSSTTDRYTDASL